jgi:hypothetical protein
MRPDEATTSTEKVKRPPAQPQGGAKSRKVSSKKPAARAPAAAPPPAPENVSKQVVHVAFRQLTGMGYYQDPFLDANVIQGGTGMGVDYAGTGPIEAIGNAVILKTGAPGSQGGGVLYRLSDGPRKGSVVFVYQGVEPTVKAGQRVLVGQQIGTFARDGSVDIGFADPSGAPLGRKANGAGEATPAGQKMRAFLSSIQGKSSTLLYDSLLTGPGSLGIVAPGTTIFEGVRVCNYIVPILQSARSLGWNGQVTSGYRSYAEQVAIHNSGIFSAAPGQSNHEGCGGGTSGSGQGAVDVSDYTAFGAAMAQLGYPLRNTLGGVDPVHFSPAGN